MRLQPTRRQYGAWTSREVELEISYGTSRCENELHQVDRTESGTVDKLASIHSRPKGKRVLGVLVSERSNGTNAEE